MSEIKPLNYEEIIVSKVNDLYKNFKDHIDKIFEVPENIKQFWKDHEDLKSRKDIEAFGVDFDKTFVEWKPLDGDMEKSILLNHHLSALQSSVIILISLETNLKKENLEIGTITQKGGIDIMIATAVQMLGIKADELTKEFNELNMIEDTEKIFEQSNKNLINIMNQNTEEAYSNLVSNILEFILAYNTAYEKLTKQSVDSAFAQKRIQLFMGYMDAFYLLSLMLVLVLKYPLDNGMMNEKAFNALIPDLKLFK